MGTLIGHRIIPSLIGAAILACGGELNLPSEGSRPAALQVIDGDEQEGAVRSRLNPLVVRVVDAGAQPMAGVAVTFGFESATPEATVSPSVAETDSEGLATAEVRLGTSEGAHIVEARVADASSDALRATFDLNALAQSEDKGKGKGKGGGGHDDNDEDDDD